MDTPKPDQKEGLFKTSEVQKSPEQTANEWNRNFTVAFISRERRLRQNDQPVTTLTVIEAVVDAMRSVGIDQMVGTVYGKTLAEITGLINESVASGSVNPELEKLGSLGMELKPILAELKEHEKREPAKDNIVSFPSPVPTVERQPDAPPEGDLLMNIIRAGVKAQSGFNREHLVALLDTYEKDMEAMNKIPFVEGSMGQKYSIAQVKSTLDRFLAFKGTDEERNKMIDEYPDALQSAMKLAFLRE